VCVKKREECPSPPLAAGPVATLITADDQSILTDTLIGDSITALASVSDTELWVGTQCSGLFTLRDGKIDKRYRARQDQLPDDGIGALHTDPQGALWATTRYGYLYAFDGMRWKIFGSAGFVKDTYRKSKNVVAFSPARSVWLLHGPNGSLWKMVDGVLMGTSIDAPPDTTTTAIAIDGSGVLFAATSKGPARFDGKILVPTGPEAMQGVPVNDISYSKERGQMLFATGAGLWIRDSANQWRELELTPGSTTRPAPSLGAPVRSVWNAAGRVVAIFTSGTSVTAVALDRAAAMTQVNFNAEIYTVGFLPFPGERPRALLASGNGAPRLERVDELGWVEFAPLRQTRETPFKWNVNNLADLDRRKGRIATIAELVTQPNAYAGDFVTVRARTVEGYRLTDDKGNTIPFLVHEAFGRFVRNREETLNIPPLRKGDVTYVLSGYFEAGGCYPYNAPYFFYVTDYYPAAWLEPQTNVLYDQLDTLCFNDATACCCEWTSPSGDANPLACPGSPCQ